MPAAGPAAGPLVIMVPANATLRLLSSVTLTVPAAEVVSDEELAVPAKTTSITSEDMFATAARALLDPLPPESLLAVPARAAATCPEPGDLVVAVLTASEAELVAVPTFDTPAKEPVATPAATVPPAAPAAAPLVPRVPMTAEATVAGRVPSPPAKAAEVAPDTSWISEPCVKGRIDSEIEVTGQNAQFLPHPRAQ